MFPQRLLTPTATLYRKHVAFVFCGDSSDMGERQPKVGLSPLREGLGQAFVFCMRCRDEGITFNLWDFPYLIIASPHQAALSVCDHGNERPWGGKAGACVWPVTGDLLFCGCCRDDSIHQQMAGKVGHLLSVRWAGTPAGPARWPGGSSWAETPTAAESQVCPSCPKFELRKQHQRWTASVEEL